MKVRELIEKYFEEIEIETTNFIPINDAVSDAAYLLLNIPIEMLRDYQKLKCSKNNLPEGIEFWKETGLVKILQNSKKDGGERYAPLGDVLEYLCGDVLATYHQLNSPDKIRLAITEIPEFYT